MKEATSQPHAAEAGRGAAVPAVRSIVGTAGHIDHGKTELVRALTGIDTDRLPEEKSRGISIELGFAHLDLEGLGRAGIVDVPGHERFIRQMLAGAHGFDLVLVVVAADDGVMPQTEEHFDIVHLLGVRRAIFVISKADLVTASRVAEVQGEIEILAAGTSFESSPVVAVSAKTGEGVDALRAAIAASLRDLGQRDDAGALRIPVDRVFVIRGRGVVVTGTALAGRISTGDEVAVLPDASAEPDGRTRAQSHRRRARVREIQVHGETVGFATAGQRVALNLSGIEKDDLERGDTVVSAGGVVRASSRLDARVEVRPAAGRPAPSHVRVRVHHATRETLGRLVWLDGVREVAPRASAFAQLVVDDPLVAMPGDRFVLRDETGERTIGGGTILSAHASRHRRALGDVAPALRSLEQQDHAVRLSAILDLSPSFAVAADEAALAAGLDRDSVVALASQEGGVVSLGTDDVVLVAASRFTSFASRVLEQVVSFQNAHVDLPGVDVEHLRGACRPVLEAKLFRLVLERIEREGTLVRSGSVVRTRDHTASLADADEALAARLLERIRKGGVMPPLVKELASDLAADAGRAARVAGVLVLRGELVRISPDLFYSRESLDDVRERLAAHLRQHREITPAAFRDLIAASRKYGIPLLDWFDREGLTIRVGDLRRLRQS